MKLFDIFRGAFQRFFSRQCEYSHRRPSISSGVTRTLFHIERRAVELALEALQRDVAVGSRTASQISRTVFSISGCDENARFSIRFLQRGARFFISLDKTHNELQPFSKNRDASTRDGTEIQ